MKLTVEYFTDILCIWAYGGQIRIEQLKRELGTKLEFHYRFIPLFAAVRARIEGQWEQRGGYAALNRHVRETTRQWDHIGIDPRVWLRTVPESSMGPHMLLKAIQLLEVRGEVSSSPVPEFDGRTRFEQCMWRMREAFFRDGENVSTRTIQNDIVERAGLPVDSVRSLIDNGEACAALHLDDEAKHRYRVPGSPTLVLNEGRQLLYGNVGYRIIEANVKELLQNPLHGEASWC